eukprot:gene7628-28298_t
MERRDDAVAQGSQEIALRVLGLALRAEKEEKFFFRAEWRAKGRARCGARTRA